VESASKRVTFCSVVMVSEDVMLSFLNDYVEPHTHVSGL
jgi:hypothetical protein